jgi:peptide/nickel transport system substrate-binding protein
MRPRLAIAAVSALALTVSLVACSKTTDKTTTNKQASQQTGAIDSDPAHSKGPAAAVPGATKGGTIKVLAETDFDFLDPTRTYTVNAMAAQLEFSRSLTAFKQTSSGKLTLVGDLATDPGKDVNGDCKVWKYTLKSGLKYETGQEITSADLAYGIARSFSPDLSEGPHYFAQWLADDPNYNKDYKGPYNGGAKIPPGVTLQGKYGITFTFKHPHCDTPYAAQMSQITPIPSSADTTPPTKFTDHPISDGPYKIGQYIHNTKLTLVRNPYWDPKTDPIRNNYPDGFEWDFGVDPTAQANRTIADQGGDQFASMQQNVPQALLQKVEGDKAVLARSSTGPTPFVYYLAINTQRVTDLKERQALEYAIDRTGVLQVYGGPPAGSPATTMLGPSQAGYKKFDLFPAGANGNAAKAKELLGGKHPKITIGYRNSESGQKLGPKLQSIFQAAGFDVQTSPVDAAHYFSSIGKKNNPWDIYLSDWAADWPTAYAVLPVLFDGRSIEAEGNNDVSYINSKDINDMIDKLSALPESKAVDQWSDLDKLIMSKASVIPLFYANGIGVNGSKLSNVTLSGVLGTTVYTSAYVKQ